MPCVFWPDRLRSRPGLKLWRPACGRRRGGGQDLTAGTAPAPPSRRSGATSAGPQARRPSGRQRAAATSSSRPECGCRRGRPTRIGDVGGMDAAAGQPPQEKRVISTGSRRPPARRARRRARRPSTLSRMWAIFGPEVGVERRPVRSRNSGSWPASRSRSHAGAVIRLCQCDRVGDRLARSAVPDDRRLALVGNPDRGDPVGAANLVDDLAGDRQLGSSRWPPDRGSRGGEELLERLLGAGDGPRPSGRTRWRDEVVPQSRARISRSSITVGSTLGTRSRSRLATHGPRLSTRARSAALAVSRRHAVLEVARSMNAATSRAWRAASQPSSAPSSSATRRRDTCAAIQRRVTPHPPR